MDNSSTIAPSRWLQLDDVVRSVLSDTAASALVLITGESGCGSSTFAKRLGEVCAPGGRVDAGSVRRLTGLPWAKGHPGDALMPWVADAPLDPRDVARSFADTVETGPHRWDAVVLVTNAHLVDQLTIEALVSVTRDAARARLLVVLDWTEPQRRGLPLSAHDHGNPVRDDLYDDVRSAADHVVNLTPLTADDVAVLAEQTAELVPSTAIAHLLRHTAGNTRSVVELLREVAPTDWTTAHLSLPAPSSVRRGVRARRRALSQPAARFVDAVAVLEEADSLTGAISARSAARVAGEAVTPEAIAEVLTSGLVIPLNTEETLVRMRDAVTRCAVLDQLGSKERRSLHATAAAVVGGQAAQLRHSWFAAAQLPDDRLADRLAAEAAVQAKSGSWASTGELLDLAARATSDPDLAGDRLLEAADAQVGAGDVAGATRHLAQLESLRETPQRNAVLGYVAVVRGRSGEADSRLRRAWELINPRRDPIGASLVAQRHVLHSLANCQALELISWADRAMGLVPPDTPAAVEAAAIRGLANAVVGSPQAALAGYASLVGSVPEGAVAARVRMASGWLHLATDNTEEAREELESAVPTDHLGGSLRISLWARAWLARVQFLTGDWEAALRTATAGASLAEQSGMALLMPLLQWTRAQVHTLRGDWAKAELCLRQGNASGQDYAIMRIPSALAQASWHESRAEYPAVVRTLTFLTEPWAHEWVNSPGFWPWADVYANALVVSGRLDEADAFLRPLEQRAADAEHASTIARLAYARGRWHGQHGDLDAARERFTAAIDRLEQMTYPYDLARVHFAFGQTLRRAGRRAEADSVLSTAREQFARLGAATYVSRCDRELAAGGVNAPRTTDAHSDVLTPQESAVAALVAQGRSNKDVAAELFLSVKTIQYHLTRVYAKLGIRSRSQLAAQWSAGDADSPTSAGV
ncbi:helix-turn-helix transcriptional regulator [Flexivirga alba]|uniref:LuxR C-terminal-related transcriptional regulator n=1 Tax=Flexivirga alba TaxID=702742 RepID=A0ABW2AIA9_9MICO